MSGRHHYIGEHDCKVATCTRVQEFPDAECPYCIVHSLENWVKENPEVLNGR